jgi:protein-disulfide isomerase
MNTNEIPRIAAPLLLAAAILVSMPHRTAVPPIELPPGEAPPPSAEQTRAALAAIGAPGGPGYDRGSVMAAVTVLEFSDFGCPYCARFASQVYPQLAEEFVRTGRVRWKYVPFVMGMFPNGDGAARAVECAAEQGRDAFARMHDRLFAFQDSWKSTGDAAGVFRSFAAATGLDVARFTACWGSDEPEARIHRANELADQLGVRATPTFFINGRRVEGALPADQFRAVLQDVMQASRRN